MGGFSNFAISFSIISILTGAVILYDYGLAWAGTAASLIGWPLVTIFVLAIAASMAEVASAYPTAGGLYYWASRMKGKAWGWWTAWFNLLGQFAIVAGIAYAAAQFLNVSIITPLLDNVGITYGNTTELIKSGDVPILTGSLVTMGVLLAICLVLNIAGISLVALLNQVSVWWHIVIVAAVVLLVLIAGKPDASGMTLFAVQPQDVGGSWANVIPMTGINLQYGAAITYPVFFAFMFSLLQANWTYTGYDASAHVAEETVGARVSSAWGIFLSVAVSAVVGYIFLFVLTTHLPNLSTLFPADLTKADAATYSTYYFGQGYAVYDTLRYNLDTIGHLLGAGIAIAMTFCTLSSVASASRMLFAFSRDDGVPGSGWLKKVSHRYRTPVNSLITIAVVAFLFTVAAFYVGALGAGWWRHRNRDRDRDQHDLPVRGVRDPDLPGTHHRWLEERAGLEPRPLVEAGRRRGAPLDRGAAGALLLPDLRQHQLAVHGRGGGPAPDLLLRLGAKPVPGTAGHGPRGGADRDRARVRARGSRDRGRGPRLTDPSVEGIRRIGGSPRASTDSAS